MTVRKNMARGSFSSDNKAQKIIIIRYEFMALLIQRNVNNSYSDKHREHIDNLQIIEVV